MPPDRTWLRSTKQTQRGMQAGEAPEDVGEEPTAIAPSVSHIGASDGAIRVKGVRNEEQRDAQRQGPQRPSAPERMHEKKLSETDEQQRVERRIGNRGDRHQSRS